jgi:DNA-binding NtrC family response regulator
MVTPKRILIVDDEPKVLFVLEHALAFFADGAEVQAFASSREALEYAARTPCDLVITDPRQPDMDGITFTAALLSLPNNPIVIWMTAYGCCAVREEAYRLGVYRCLEKPLEITAIRRIVREALESAYTPTESYFPG